MQSNPSYSQQHLRRLNNKKNDTFAVVIVVEAAVRKNKKVEEGWRIHTCMVYTNTPYKGRESNLSADKP